VRSYLSRYRRSFSFSTSFMTIGLIKLEKPLMEKGSSKRYLKEIMKQEYR
jgi:hypothetical protein